MYYTQESNQGVSRWWELNRHRDLIIRRVLNHLQNIHTHTTNIGNRYLTMACWIFLEMSPAFRETAFYPAIVAVCDSVLFFALGCVTTRPLHHQLRRRRSINSNTPRTLPLACARAKPLREETWRTVCVCVWGAHYRAYTQVLHLLGLGEKGRARKRERTQSTPNALGRARATRTQRSALGGTSSRTF